MKLCFRWYGQNDPISLDKIRQIPNVKGIVSAIYDIPVGEIWPKVKIKNLVDRFHAKGFDFIVI